MDNPKKFFQRLDTFLDISHTNNLKIIMSLTAIKELKILNNNMVWV